MPKPNWTYISEPTLDTFQMSHRFKGKNQTIYVAKDKWKNFHHVLFNRELSKL
jgi:hypothetical protein